MKNKLIIFLATVAMFLCAPDAAKAQFSHLDFVDYGVGSIVPKSLTSVTGDIWVDVINDGEGFAVSEVVGMVYKNGKPFVEGKGGDFRIEPGRSKTTVDGTASIARGVTLLDLFELLFFFDPNDFTVDLSIRITLDSGDTRVESVRNLPVTTLLKIDDKTTE